MAENGITLGCQTLDANHRLYGPNTNEVKLQERDAQSAELKRLVEVLLARTSPEQGVASR